MKPYHKIQSIFKREQEKPCKFIEGQWSIPEFEYLKDNSWVFTEKIDGTNVRIMWDGEAVKYGGRTDNAQMPTFLLSKLQELFHREKFKALEYPPMCLYGEGYGAKIQKGGGRYIPDGCDFILFDVVIDDWWLKWTDVVDVARKLNIATVPIVAEGTLEDGIALIKQGVKSTFYDDLAEGIVCKPKVELFARNGSRIITKLKHRDFKGDPQ